MIFPFPYLIPLHLSFLPLGTSSELSITISYHSWLVFAFKQKSADAHAVVGFDHPLLP